MTVHDQYRAALENFRQAMALVDAARGSMSLATRVVLTNTFWFRYGSTQSGISTCLKICDSDQNNFRINLKFLDTDKIRQIGLLLPA